jgi:prevent-host-death family protein
MDRHITATEANQRFSEMLRDVGDGESFTVTSRGKPVARMVPAEAFEKGDDLSELIAFMKKQPVRISGHWKREDLYER